VCVSLRGETVNFSENGEKMTTINRETVLPIGWGIATRSDNRGYYIVETRSTRTSARNRARQLNARSSGQRYRTVRLSASHP
jgi:hypothetical protein